MTAMLPSPTHATTAPPVSVPVIELTGVTKRYGDVTALSALTISVGSGEVVAILGPNGAGKTTAIGIMLGLRPATEGTVRVLGGHPGSREVRSRVGAMLQESGIPATLRVSEVIDLFRSYYPMALPREVVVAAAGLEDLQARRAGQLSGGQRQRLYFAIAICGDPDIVFLDEPTTGMDVESRHRFWDEVRSFAASGKTILFTTHQLEEADALADRVIVIDRGTIVASGTPSELKARGAGKRLRLRGAFDAAELAGWPGVRRVDRAGAHLVLSVDDATDVMRRLFADGRAVDELVVEEADLESAFLDITRSTETD